MFFAAISSIKIILKDEGEIFEAGCCNYGWNHSRKRAILAHYFHMLNAWLAGVFFMHQNN